MKVIQAEIRHAGHLSRYYLGNATRFQRWDPLTDKNHHSVQAWEKRLRQRVLEQRRGNACHFIGIDENETSIMGACSLTNIVRGPFQSCYMGYSVDANFEGQGIMTTIVTSAIDYAFGELGLHRIMANHMPANDRSARLLTKLGFTREGVARKYLLISGRWEDHVLNALINPAHVEDMGA